MVVRLGAALCVVAILFAYSSSSVIKSGHTVRNAIRGVAAAEPWPTQSALLERKKLNAAASGVTILGTASTYNPFRPGFRSGGTETFVLESLLPGTDYDVHISKLKLRGDVRRIGSPSVYR